MTMITATYQKGATLKLFLLFLMTILIVGGSAMYFGHWLGFRLGSESLGKTAQAYHQLKVEHKNQQEELLNIKEQMIKANEERDVSIKNMNDIRNSLDMLQKREKFLISQRDAYQAMVSNETEEASLKIFDQSIKPLPENAFEYAFDLVLLQPKNASAKRITVDVTLMDGDTIVRVPLEPSEYEITGFKRVQGRFIMPKGFTPKKLKLSVTGIGAQSVEQYYNWRYGKHIKNMPQGLIDVPPLENLDVDSPVATQTNAAATINE